MKKIIKYIGVLCFCLVAEQGMAAESSAIPQTNESWAGETWSSINENQEATIVTEPSETQATTSSQREGSSQSEEERSDTDKVQTPPQLHYQTHVEKFGWQGLVTAGEVSGTSGQGKRLEAIRIFLEEGENDGGIEYRTHIQNIGWEKEWRKNGEHSGTEGQAKRLEAIQIKLTGAIATEFDLFYRVHAEQFGWLGWAKNGEQAGTAGFAYRLEAIEIQVLPKGQLPSDYPATASFYQYRPLEVKYQTHVQNAGWQGWKSNGETSGTSGQALRLEGIRLTVADLPLGMNGGIRYRTHVQDIGWQQWVENGELAGTTGKSKRLEAIQVSLTGSLAQHYSIYYRVHAQNMGWLGWAKNGEQAGTAGFAYRLEAIQIKIVPKHTKITDGKLAFNRLLSLPFYNQYAVNAPMVCEGASLLQGLHFKGRAKQYGLRTFLQAMPIAPDNNPNHGFGGSPFKVQFGIYQSIFPQPLATWGQKFGHVQNISGQPASALLKEIDAGNPVVVYLTLNFAAPQYQQYFFGRAVDNMHVMTLDGYQNGFYHVTDPDRKGKYWVSKSAFESSYQAVGRWAVVIR